MSEIITRTLCGLCAFILLMTGGGIASGVAQAQSLPVVSNIRIWLDADDVNAGGSTPGSGAVITQWKDKSGNAQHVTSSGSANATYETSGLNGHPSIRFNNGATFTHSNIFTGSQNSETTIFLVQAHVTLVKSIVVSLNGDNNGGTPATARFGMHMPWTDGKAYFDAGGTSGTARVFANYPVAATTPTISTTGNSTSGFSGLTGTLQMMRIDGTSIASDTTAVSPYVSGGFRMGAVSGVGYDGRISEVIVYDRALSLAEIKQVECYLSDKWSITTPHACTTPVTITVDKDRSAYAASSFGEFAVPSNEFIYELGIQHLAGYKFDGGSMFISDTLSDELTFFNGDLDGASGPYSDPVGFANIGSALSFDPASGLKYSNSVTAPSSAADCNYTPISGYDPNVRHVCITLSGYLQDGAVELQYRVRLD